MQLNSKEEGENASCGWYSVLPDIFTVQNGLSRAAGIETEQNMSACGQWQRCVNLLGKT